MGLGIGVVDKIRILFALSVQPLDKILAQESPSLTFTRISEKLLGGVNVKVNGALFSIVDFESLGILSSRFENYVRLWFTPRDGEVVLDIGAHIGKYTIAAAKRVGKQGQVIALEPDARNYATLCRNIAVNKLHNVVTVNAAAWTGNCTLPLYLGKADGRHSTKRDLRLGHSTVRAVSTDMMLESLRLSRVDWIKVDVEGAELEALSGMQHTLKSFKPRVILEASTNNLASIKSLLRRCDYQLVQISPPDVADQIQFSYFLAVPLSEFVRKPPPISAYS